MTSGLRSRRLDWSWLATGPAALLVLLFVAVPAAFGLFNTFTDSTPFTRAWHFVGLDNYGAVLSDTTSRVAFLNALLLALITVPTEAALGLALAGLLRRPFAGRGLVRVLLLAPWLVSPIAAGVMWHFLYNGQVGLVGWIGGLFGASGQATSPLGDLRWALPSVALVEVWRMAPLAAFLLLPGVLAVPQDDIDQATVMGSPLFTTWRVAIIPRIRVLLLTVLLLLVAQSLTTFDSILVLTGGGPGSNTLTPALYAYNLAVQTNNWPVGVAASWLLVALVLVVGSIYIRLLRAAEER
jgi:multiple sugar transport system permease protein